MIQARKMMSLSRWSWKPPQSRILVIINILNFLMRLIWIIRRNPNNINLKSLRSLTRQVRTLCDILKLQHLGSLKGKSKHLMKLLEMETRGCTIHLCAQNTWNSERTIKEEGLKKWGTQLRILLGLSLICKWLQKWKT